jgi:hypothetical protein
MRRRSKVALVVVGVVVIVALLVAAFAAVELNDLYSSASSVKGSGGNASTIGSNGLMLSVSTNATQIKVGQSLRVKVSVFNTLSQVNNVTASDDWPFRGIFLSLWPDCFYTDDSATNSYSTPTQVVVLMGDYTIANMSSVAKVDFEFDICHEGVDIKNVIFGGDGSQANVTGIGYAANDTEGPFQASNSFTTNGYWDLPANSHRSTPVLIDYPIDSLGQQAALWPTTTPFSPGVYTVGVADEWGQAVILHFTVTS